MDYDTCALNVTNNNNNNINLYLTKINSNLQYNEYSDS